MRNATNEKMKLHEKNKDVLIPKTKGIRNLTKGTLCQNE